MDVVILVSPYFTLFPLKFIEGKAKSVISSLFTFFPLSPYILSENLRSQCLREWECYFSLIWFDTSDSIAHTLPHMLPHTHTHTLFNTPSPTYVFKLKRTLSSVPLFRILMIFLKVPWCTQKPHLHYLKRFKWEGKFS